MQSPTFQLMARKPDCTRSARLLRARGFPTTIPCREIVRYVAKPAEVETTHEVSEGGPMNKFALSIEYCVM